jgi:hypothetical protein
MLMVFFLWLAGRFWHPYYGFTKLLQLDRSAAKVMLPVLRHAPIYVYPAGEGYDGMYYAQLAASPMLQDPSLPRAIDELPYRCRRILLSWLAWIAGAGESVAAIRAYAWLNLAFWLALAAVLWRLLPTDDGRATIAWAGIMFSAGTLLSVRLALTDLAATMLIASALLCHERGRTWLASALLGLAGLTRETALLAGAAWLPSLRSRRRWQTAAKLLLIALPLAAWLAYCRVRIGPASPGQNNLGWPATGWVGRWLELGFALRMEQNHALVATSILTHLALTVQMLAIMWRPQPRDPWWWLGASYVGLLLCLGPQVWGGLPGAAARVLLPLTLAFNVRSVRTRSSLVWLLLGNLSCADGLLALADRADEPNTLVAHWSLHRVYQVNIDQRWYVPEKSFRITRVWCRQEGGLAFRIWPYADRVRVRLRVRTFRPGVIEVRHQGQQVWQGLVGEKWQWIELAPLPAPDGELFLEMRDHSPPQKEGPRTEDRLLGFACSEVELN